MNGWEDFFTAPDKSFASVVKEICTILDKHIELIRTLISNLEKEKKWGTYCEAAFHYSFCQGLIVASYCMGKEDDEKDKNRIAVCLNGRDLLLENFFYELIEIRQEMVKLEEAQDEQIHLDEKSS